MKAIIAPASTPRRGRVLRLLGYTLLGSLALAVAIVPIARAQAEKVFESAGLALLTDLGPRLVGQARAVDVNGQRMFLASGQTSLALSEVLAAMERHCQGESPAPAAEVGAWLDRLDVSADRFAAPQRWLTARSADPAGSVGQVACFAPSAQGRRSLLNAAIEFAHSGNLSSFGEARYLIARRDPASDETHVLTIWAEGDLNVRAMFPSGVDAPGADSEQAPRPRDALRLLSARVQGMPYAMHMYGTAEAPAAVLAAYERAMSARGFTKPELAAASGAVESERESQTFIKDGGFVFVMTSPSTRRETLVSLFEFAGPGEARVAAEDAP